MSEIYAAMFAKNGTVEDSGYGADATLVTATIAVPMAQRAIVTGIVAFFDDPVTVKVDVTVRSGSAVLFLLPWDFTNGLLIFHFPNPLHSLADGENMTVELGAGPATIAGRVLAFHALD